MEEKFEDKGNNKITEQSYKGKVKNHNYINKQKIPKVIPETRRAHYIR
jgi:hypothetical protein